MESAYYLQQVFEKTDFVATGFPAGEYESCTFIYCDLSGIDLSGRVFVDCLFDHCNLGMARLVQTAFCSTRFVQCKLTGLQFQHCRPFLFSVEFEGSQLELSSFIGMKLKKTRFSNCQLKETDFSEVDLTEAVFDKCDLTAAIFDHTNLERADFSTAFNYTIDPEQNRLAQACFSMPEIEGLLRKYQIRII